MFTLDTDLKYQGKNKIMSNEIESLFIYNNLEQLGNKSYN